VAPAAIEKLTSYSWPGNVRELENCLRRAVLLSLGDVILEEHLKLQSDQPELRGAGQEQLLATIDRKLEELIPEILRFSSEKTYANVIDLVEKTLIAKVLQQCGYNQVKASKMLGISRNTLRHRMKKFHLATDYYQVAVRKVTPGGTGFQPVQLLYVTCEDSIFPFW
jgi:DNA-binding NtrC family response regulator